MGESKFYFGPEHYGIPRGWWKLDNEWYLTFDAVKKELRLSKPKLTELLRRKRVRTQILENPHSNRPFRVYNAEDLDIDENPQVKSKQFW